MEGGWMLLSAALMVFVAPTPGRPWVMIDPTLNISRAGCGETKLCISAPENCAPCMSATCLFASFNTTMGMMTSTTAETTTTTAATTTTATTTATTAGTATMNATTAGATTAGTTTTAGPAAVIRDVNIELAGESEGYIAVGLTRSQNTVTGRSLVFICGQNSSNNNSFFFLTMTRNNTNGMLMSTNISMSNITAYVNLTSIKCTFTAFNRDISRSYLVFLANGTLNGSMLNPLNIILETLVENPFNPSPTTTPTTSRASGVIQTHALLILLNFFTLLAMLKV